MKKFRRKLTIEAEQFFLAAPQSPKNVYQDPFRIEPCFVITAHNQRVYIKDGDWIVQEPGFTDRAYPITDEIMKQTYEEI
jgi:hypothetical protein